MSETENGRLRLYDIVVQFEELGFKGLKAGCSEFFTLYDKLRQQRDEKDRFRQADKAAADLCGRHHRGRQALGVWSDPDRCFL